MRQRKLKDLEERLIEYKEYYVDEPEEKKENWKKTIEIKGSQMPEKLFLEVGAGKGKFIGENARQNQNYGYIGIEGQPSVSVVATKKIREMELKNVIFINGYLQEPSLWFGEEELDGVYLNFSDPWPKKRHEKRRLNHRSYLKAYEKIIKDGGFIKIKTDNDELFRFGVEEAKSIGMEIDEITEDLHNSKYMETNIKTEYEEKFSSKGKSINYLKILIKK